MQAATMLLLARYSEVEEFALGAGFLALAAFLQMVVDLGISTLVVRVRASEPHSCLPRSAMRTYSKISISLAVACLVAVVALGLLVDSDYLLLTPLALWIGADRSADVWLSLLVADGLAKVSGIALIARRVGWLLTFLVLTLLNVPALLAFSVSGAVVSIVAAAWAGRVVACRLPNGPRVTVRDLLKNSRHYWLNSAATQARNLDITVVGAAAGTTQAGFYAIPSRLTGPLRLVPTSMATAILPAVAASPDRQRLRSILRLAAVVWVGMCLIYVVLATAAPVALPWLVGEGYAGAIRALQVSLLGLIFASAASLLGAFLQGAGRESYVGWTSLVTTLTYLGGVTLGAILAGAIGAAIGGAVAYVLQALLLMPRVVEVSYGSRKEPRSGESLC